MTDTEIIEALECCKNPIPMCDDCPVGSGGMCFDLLKDYALDLINHQKAEIEELKAMIEAAENHYNPLPFKGIFDEKIAEVRAKAIREFAERLFERVVVKTLVGKSEDYSDGFIEATCWYDEEIDNLVKEMTEATP